MVTDRDIVCKGLAQEGFDVHRATARDVMTPGIHCCREDDDLAKAVRHMEALGLRRLPVINKSKRMVGMLALGDVGVLAPLQSRADNRRVLGGLCRSTRFGPDAARNRLRLRGFVADACGLWRRRWVPAIGWHGTPSRSYSGSRPLERAWANGPLGCRRLLADARPGGHMCG